jgi:hypothetical protein
MDSRNKTHGFDLNNTEHGGLFEGQYVLIEIHGQKGFTYKQTVKEAGKGPENKNHIHKSYMLQYVWTSSRL